MMFFSLNFSFIFPHANGHIWNFRIMQKPICIYFVFKFGIDLKMAILSPSLWHNFELKWNDLFLQFRDSEKKE